MAADSKPGAMRVGTSGRFGAFLAAAVLLGSNPGATRSVRRTYRRSMSRWRHGSPPALTHCPIRCRISKRSHAGPPYSKRCWSRSSPATGAQAIVHAKSTAYQPVAIREGGSSFIAASDDSGTGRDPTIILNLGCRILPSLCTSRQRAPFATTKGGDIDGMTFSMR